MEDVFFKFKENGLGLVRDNKVRLLQHNKNWAEVFKYESSRISKELKIDSLKLHHGGSTAIPGIVAKPVLDIIGEVKELEEVDLKKQALSDIGYEYKGEYGIVGRRYSVLYNQDKSIGYCHFHIFLAGSDKLLDHLLFKDYLIQKPEAAKRYETLKLSLSTERSHYSKAKAQMIMDLIREARTYFNK